VRLARMFVVGVLLATGIVLLLVAMAISCAPAAFAQSPYGQDPGYSSYGGGSPRSAPPIQYTDHAQPASNGRTIALYVDHDFPDRWRDSIVRAMRQWNFALNGFVQFQAKLLPDRTTWDDVARIRRSAWAVVLVDSRHPMAQQGEGREALAVTVGNQNGGVVYVIGDRIGGRDLTGVVMHEFGHVLGAGHDHSGLMAPVYSVAGARCIDHDAVAMVAQVQHLPLQQLNWCEPAGYDPRYQPRSASNNYGH
jgi:Matrixin